MDIIQKIKQKKELADIDDTFVKKFLTKYKLENLTPKQEKIIIKEVRQKLRILYGLFRTKQKGPMLERHASTRERLGIYINLYKKIFAITGNPKTILDLGCGVNPFSYPYLGCKPKYYAYDISVDEINEINEYFKEEKIKGKAEILDLLNIDKLPSVDVAFLFKMTDMIDQGKGHKKTEELLKAIPAKWIVASFPTKTMSGKRMNVPHRNWMEWLCRRLGWSYEIIEFTNELFYVIGK